MRETRWLSSAEQRAWRAYLRATQQVQVQLDRELERDAGMPFAYFQILVMLSEASERSLRMSDLAERTWSSRGAFRMRSIVWRSAAGSSASVRCRTGGVRLHG